MVPPIGFQLPLPYELQASRTILLPNNSLWFKLFMSSKNSQPVDSQSDNDFHFNLTLHAHSIVF
jgi:hypothetical protein